jgi:lipoate-protein ligase A
MIYLPNNSTDPHFNLAFEETIFNAAEPGETYILLWQNSPSVIIGKHQNTIAEINGQFIRERGVNVVRRMTGGGAVYHDLGNLNFSFIQPAGGQVAPDFQAFVRPVMAALKKLGIATEFSGRNDLTIGGKKFSGNAQCIKNGKGLHHGTLLFDVNLDDLEAALCPDMAKIASKGVASVRSRVTNISGHLSRKMTVAEFKETLLLCIAQDQPLTEQAVTEADLAAAHSLADCRYRTWDWNYGQSPSANIKREKRFIPGKVEAWIDVENGRIRELAFYGDFFSVGDPAAVAKALIGLRYEYGELAAALAGFDIKQDFGGISREELLEVLI